jgi:hypothetical protein
MKKTKTVAILATPGVQLLDVSGPLDVFAEANMPSHQLSKLGFRMVPRRPMDLRTVGSFPGAACCLALRPLRYVTNLAKS